MAWAINMEMWFCNIIVDHKMINSTYAHNEETFQQVDQINKF
jgi:hypothetical protein